VIELKLHDPDRNPPSWTEILRPGQYVAFAKTADTGATCDSDGRTFQEVEAATCLVFDTLAEAETFCRRKVGLASNVRIEIFDSTGRANSPLLVIVHPSKAARLEGNPRGMQLRTWSATILLAVAGLSFWYDFARGASAGFFPTLIGINLVVVAARLFQLNKSYQHAERVRQERLAEHESAARERQPPARS
jgi:hypothetical protein